MGGVPSGDARVDMVSFPYEGTMLMGLPSAQVHPLPSPRGSEENGLNASSQAPAVEPEREVLGLPSAPPIAVFYELAGDESTAVEGRRGRTPERTDAGMRYVSPPHVESRLQESVDDLVHGEIQNRS